MESDKVVSPVVSPAAQFDLLYDFLIAQRRALLQQAGACEKMAQAIKAQLPEEQRRDIVTYRDGRQG